MADVLGYLKDLIIDNPREYWIEGPKRIGYQAFDKAAEVYGVPADEYTRADAAKHMAWQNELTKRIPLPQPVAGTIANLIGVFKEPWDMNLPNSPMDIRNNAYGAFKLPMDGDTVKNAVLAAGRTVPNMGQALLQGLPYARDEEPTPEPQKTKNLRIDGR